LPVISFSCRSLPCIVFTCLSLLGHAFPFLSVSLSGVGAVANFLPPRCPVKTFRHSVLGCFPCPSFRFFRARSCLS
jgi:hypothetical protein